MAKKRVHEIAKERGISSKEVIAVLQRAGLDVKAAASSVDENDIRMAFSNGGKPQDGGQGEPSAAAGGSAQEAPAQGQPPRQSGGDGQPRPAAAPSGQQPRQDRGRRRRTPWVEPDLTPQEPVVEEVPINRVQSGATVKEVSESLGL